MKKVISIEEKFSDSVFARPVLSVVKDPEKMPVVYIGPDKDGASRQSHPDPMNMPVMPAGYIKCKKHDCL